MSDSSVRFLFDEHLAVAACSALREEGVDAIHVAEAGLRGAADPAVLERARTEGRIVVTRDYADYSALVGAYGRRETRFPGVLFVPRSIPPGDVSLLVRSLLRWTGSRAGRGNPVADTAGWLEAAE